VAVDLRVVEGEYLQDLLDQPQALENTFKSLDRSKELLDLASRLHRAGREPGKFELATKVTTTE
jgi:hypothetical protein